MEEDNVEEFEGLSSLGWIRFGLKWIRIRLEWLLLLLKVKNNVVGYNSNSKVGLIRALMETCSDEELKNVKLMLVHIQEELDDKKIQTIGKESDGNERIWSCILRPFGSKVDLPDPHRFACLTREYEWWRQFRPEQFVALDCEFVMYKNKKGFEKQRAVSVAVVNHKYQRMNKYSWIRHNPSDVEITPIQVAINGITERDLMRGEPLEVVQSELVELFKDKIVVTVGGFSDFSSLGLCMPDFRAFDLQTFYYRSYVNNRYVAQPMSLRDIAFYHFSKSN